MMMMITMIVLHSVIESVAHSLDLLTLVIISRGTPIPENSAEKFLQEPAKDGHFRVWKTRFIPALITLSLPPLRVLPTNHDVNRLTRRST